MGIDVDNNVYSAQVPTNSQCMKTIFGLKK